MGGGGKGKRKRKIFFGIKHGEFNRKHVKIDKKEREHLLLKKRDADIEKFHKIFL